MILNKFLHNFFVWRIKHLSDKQFVLILSIVIGICAGLAAVVLKTIVHYIQNFLTQDFNIEYENYFFIAFPLIGILLTVLYVQIFRKGKIGRGVSNILYEIARKSGIIKPDKMYSHIISSSLTVGFGGSAGLEAPIVVTGSAFGSNIGRLMHLDSKKRTLLIGCGAAAAISAIFNSPIAGVLFAMEVLLVDFSVPAFIPLLIASVTGNLISKFFLGEEILFYFFIKDSFTISDLPYYIVLAIITGIISVYFTRIMYKIDKIFKKIESAYKKALLGGLLLGVLIFIFPPFFGEGYTTVKALLSEAPSRILNNSLFFDFYQNQWVLLAFILGMILIKAFATSITIAAGGNGGIFAPSMFVGALVGFFFARLININFSDPISENNFTLIAMAGTTSAILHAPLTAIFLIAEITNGYELLVPLMLVSAISYTTAIIYEPYSIYTKQLAQKGSLLTHDKDKEVLRNLQIDKLVETDILTVNYNALLGDLIEIISKSKRNIFPVINDKNELLGIILLDDIREIMFKPNMYNSIPVKDLMHAPPEVLSIGERMEEVMKKFESTGAWNLPVIQDGKYLGFLSKSNIFSRYRSMLIKDTKEE